MSKGKCILLVRVSTQRQDFDEQERQLYDLAIADGYKDNEIIAICEKESGIKLKEDERRGLNRLKEEVAKGGVTCVYAWEVSRIGRKKKVIFSITEFLADRGIQLIVKEPYIKLLNPDGTINDGAETVLTLFAQISESEMRNKQSRWARTRKHNAEVGKWNGGKNIKYGYTLDENNYYMVNEDEAKVIRLVYELYTTTAMGQTNLRNELRERGINLTLDRLQKMLSDIGYTGEPYTTDIYVNGKLSKGYTIKYPAIISREIFDKAEAKRLESNVNCYRGQSYYFAKGLFRCPVCGYAYQGYKHNKIYCCLAYKHDNKDIAKCNNNITININLLDTLLWHSAMTQWMIARMRDTEDYRKSILEQINTTAIKIDACWKELEEVDGKLERIGDMYADGVYSKEKYQTMVNKVREGASEVQRRKQQLTEEHNRLDQIYTNLCVNSDNEVADRLQNTLSDAFSLDDLKTMYDIVHQFVKSVAVEDVEKFDRTVQTGKGIVKKVTITLVDGSVEVYFGYVNGNKYLFYNAEKKPIDPKKVLRKLG